jgi:methionyl-tRNA formyltransferase
MSGVAIHNLIRGLSPYPGCFFSDKNEEWTIKIYEASLLSESHDFELGKIICTKGNENSS